MSLASMLQLITAIWLSGVTKQASQMSVSSQPTGSHSEPAQRSRQLDSLGLLGSKCGRLINLVIEIDRPAPVGIG